MSIGLANQKESATVRPSETDQPFDAVHVIAREFSVFYGSNEAVEKVTFDVPAGQVTAIIGPSGCGKSTFLRAINRMNDLIPRCRAEGELVFDDLNLANLEHKAIERALTLTEGVQKEAAKLLGISARAIHYKIRKYKIDMSRFGNQR